MVSAPRFLRLPDRPDKPRPRGLTSVIDGGLPTSDVQAILDGAGRFVDVWKLGWGSAYLDPSVDAKVALLRRHDVHTCPGGTLLEVAALQGRAAECLAWAGDKGFTRVEVSDGLGRLGDEEKTSLIRTAARSFTVLAEVGSKDPSQVLAPSEWVQLARADLDAGASWVIAEGRESGTVGLYGRDGSVRAEVVDALLDEIGPDRLLFEAPRKDQQAWLIRHVGPDVNIANVAPREVLGLEALRLGLRADTTLAVHDRAPVP
jgi:phosphosulfolactate synthase